MKPLVILLVYILCIREAAAVPDLLLGQAKLKQAIKKSQLMQGVTHYQVVRGYSSDKDFYTLSSGVLTNRQAERYKNTLTALGYRARVEQPAEQGPNKENLGVIVYTGNFVDENKAKEQAHRLDKEGLKFAVRYSAENGGKTTGPFQISLLAIDLNLFEGRAISALAHDHIKGLATTSRIAQQHQAIAAVNGGFFVWRDQLGTTGDLAGVSAINGELVSEAVDQRPAVLLSNDAGKTTLSIYHHLRNQLVLTSGESHYPIQGINRAVGKALNCGNVDDEFFSRSAHDHLCTNNAEAIIYDRSFANEVYLDKGMVLVFKANVATAKVMLNHPQKLAIPDNGLLVFLSQQWLDKYQPELNSVANINVIKKVISEDTPIPLVTSSYLINGGPTLVKDGKIVISDRAIQGWDVHYPALENAKNYSDHKDKLIVNKAHFNRAGFYYGWVVRRHPRTAIGITDDNIVYIAVVYGRQPQVSAGASISEMAKLMHQLGAVDAINLDGGGSSMMVINSQQTGRSSDKDGERKVGDALLLLPKKID